jgi:hypothetical protein
MRNNEGKVYIWEGINQADAAKDFACHLRYRSSRGLLHVFFLIFLALKNKNRKERSRKVVFVVCVN